MGSGLAQVLLLLGVATLAVLAFHRFRVPTSLAYLLVGVLLGPHTAGPVVDAAPIAAFAEFGIVFLLFTVGLNFSLPQIQALRRSVLGLGVAQVVLTTALVALVAAAFGASWPVAFVIGAVVTQSSTSILGKQLIEQGEDNAPHGRLAIALSVFQDITAVPFVVVIPVLGAQLGAAALAGALGIAMAKGLLAFVLVFFVGRRVLRPFFHQIAERRSAELFTLTVLFVSLLAAWTTFSQGLSLAFGAFLAGMVLGETEFRHQVEATVRPFRDVLLGLFFVGVGMLVDPAKLPDVWLEALLGAVAMLALKAVLVAPIVWRANVDLRTAWRVGLLLAVGGEFGFALLGLALGAELVDSRTGQTILTAVLFSMVLAPILIRFNHEIASWLTPRGVSAPTDGLPSLAQTGSTLEHHVIICGYGRVGQGLGHILEQERVPYVALDLDAARVREAHLAGEPVFFGDSAQREILEGLGLTKARLLVLAHDDKGAALKTLQHARALRPELPVMVRTRDIDSADELQAAGASAVFPETLEAGLMIASQALREMGVPLSRVLRVIDQQRTAHYRQLRQLFLGESPASEPVASEDADRLHAVQLSAGSPAAGRSLGELQLEGVAITALVRGGRRQLQPPVDTVLAQEDTLVLFGSPDALRQAEHELLAPGRRARLDDGT
ncbi:MAG: cation:proton antiporter [Planctomycetes bacterium]|nr:cation:proton antiporter [Planctomycetota bacterium]